MGGRLLPAIWPGLCGFPLPETNPERLRQVVRQARRHWRPPIMSVANHEEAEIKAGSLSTRTQHQFIVEMDEAGRRLDVIVAEHCPELSRTRVQEFIDAGHVHIDGKAARKGSLHPRGGEKISIEITARPAMVAKAEAIPLKVLYEDEDVIAVNKPAGMTVHAGAGNPRGTLVNALLGRGQALSEGGDALRPGIVHRLDKETSGIILVAKNDLAHAKLAECFRQREVKKTYIALLEGHLKGEKGRIELAIMRDPKRRTRMTARRSIVLGSAREARTDWRTLAQIGPTTLV